MAKSSIKDIPFYSQVYVTFFENLKLYQQNHFFIPELSLKQNLAFSLQEILQQLTFKKPRIQLQWVKRTTSIE